MKFWDRWLQPERAWQGRRALVRAETCYRILEVTIWIIGITGVVGMAMTYLRAPDWLSRSTWFFMEAGIQIPVLAAALFRGWPFRLRFGLLALDLLTVVLASGVLFGLVPNGVLVSLLLIMFSTLIFGTPAGVAAIVAVTGINVLVAWGWVSGTFPLHAASQGGGPVMDYRAMAVWIRVITVGCAGSVTIVIMLRYLLGDLNRALQQSNNALQRLAGEQESRMRAEAARFEAERVAREAQKFDALGRMASGVAHDFNNTLCVMKLWTGLLADDPNADIPSMRAALQDIRDATTNAQQLTSQLLAFSRDEAGKKGACDLAKVVPRDCETLARILSDDIAVECRAEGAAIVPLSAGQIQEMLLNLGINARDAMPQGGRLSIAVENLSLASPQGGLPPGRYCRLTVSDSGTGMSEEVKARIFEPFFTTKAPGAGTGLGLAMVYGLVKGVGGSIAVESRIGVGTSFSIVLPIVAAAALGPESKRGVLEAAARCPVLVVDKQTEMGALVERILGNDGYPTVWVRNSRAALEQIRSAETPIGLLILEAVMPEVPAREIIAAASERNPACKIIVISGHMMDAAILEGIERGRYHKLSKPFDADALRRVISDALAA
jgi:signal transduction histidine kinase